MIFNKIKVFFNALLTKRIYQVYFLIFLSVLISGLFLATFYTSIDNFSYDFMMKFIKKPIRQDESLLLIDIDDITMNNIPYRWQWPRFLHGDALEVLADFGAKAAVYDIEFLGESTPGINMNEVGNIKQKLQNNFARIYEDYKKSTTILANDPSAASRLKSTHDNFNAKIFEYYSNINSDIDKLLMDNDIYLAKRARYFGKAYGTVNMLFDKELSEADIYKKAEDENLVNLERYGTNSLLLLKNKKHHPAIKKVNISEFTTEKILAELKGVGFTKVERDKDASIRFIDLFFEKKGFVIPQLALKPFFDIYEIKPAMIDLSANDKIILKKVKFNNK